MTMFAKCRWTLVPLVAMLAVLLVTGAGTAAGAAHNESPSGHPRLLRSVYVPPEPADPFHEAGVPWLVLPNDDILSVNFQRTIYRLNPSGSSASVFWKAPSCTRIADVVLGPHGRVFVTGTTGACLSTTSNAVQPRYGGGSSDAYIVGLSSAGHILYSSFLGGSESDQTYSLASDGHGKVYLSGLTQSHNFPLKHAGSRKFKNGIDANFVARLSLKTGLLYSRFLDGSDEDGVTAIAADRHGNTYVGGWTGSVDFPTTKHAFQRKHPLGAGQNAFVAKLGSKGKLLYSTYLGGRGRDTVPCDRCLAVYHGQATVTGITQSRHFPLKHASQRRYGGGAGEPIIINNGLANGDAFVTTFSRSGSALVASTYLGGGRSDAATSLALDRTGHIYVGGGTYSKNFPVRLAIQKHFAGDNEPCHGEGTFCPSGDGFVAEVKRHGGVMYSTYLGGRSTDYVDRVTTHHGEVYVASYTDSSNFPLVPSSSKRLDVGQVLSRITWR